MKQLLVLGALALSLDASAQSSVTIGGVIDLGLVRPIAAKGIVLDATPGNSGLFIRGLEELGGGWKASFMLRSAFSPESGGLDGKNNGRPFWYGETTVGLITPLGSIKMGRSLTAAQSQALPYDNFSSNMVAAVVPSVFEGRYQTAPEDRRDLAGLSRTDGVTYVSPSTSGLTAQATYGFKNSNGGGSPYEGNYSLASGGLTYSQGPLRADVAMERNRRGDRLTWAGAIYDLGGGFRFIAAFSRHNPIASTNEAHARIFAADMTRGAWTFKIAYGRNKTQNMPLTNSRLGLGADFRLSKRTLLYATVGRETGTANTMDGVKNSVGTSFGIRHTF